MTKPPLNLMCALMLLTCACDKNAQLDAQPTATEAKAIESKQGTDAPAKDEAPDAKSGSEQAGPVDAAPKTEEVAANGGDDEASESQPAESQPAESQPKAKRTCVKDPKADAARRLKTSASKVKVYNDTKDLDGDKVKERTVSDESGATGAGDHHLYLSNNGCWAHAGVFLGFGPSRAKSSTMGLRDLENWKPDGCMGAEGTVELFKWNGSKYKKSKSVFCECPGSDVKRAPECPKTN